MLIQRLELGATGSLAKAYKRIHQLNRMLKSATGITKRIQSVTTSTEEVQGAVQNLFNDRVRRMIERNEDEAPRMNY